MAVFTRNDLFRDEAAKLIEAEIARLSEEISLGLIETIEEYRVKTGKLAGLRLCLEYLEEAAVSVAKKTM